METEDDESLTENKIRILASSLYVEVSPEKWPIVYNPVYDISFFGMEKLHTFDSGKWGKIWKLLKEAGMITSDDTVRSSEATEEELEAFHTKDYLDSLRWSSTVARIVEIPPVACLPNCIVQTRMLRSFRYQTGGTILSGKLAMERGWSIHIGGGFHHCSRTGGGGFCVYADITGCVKFLFTRMADLVRKVMIVDLDAHQGNGHERDFMGDKKRVYIFDMYNSEIYPKDNFAKKAIQKNVELRPYTEDHEYLHLLVQNLGPCLDAFQPDFLIYNAGTDVLAGDPLGCLSITDQGILKRDEIVFREAKERNIPISMVTSGGYQRQTANIIADSILNLRNIGLISKEPVLRSLN